MKNMGDAYQAAASLMRSEMEKYDQKGAQALRELKESDIIVVKGDYDKIEDVFAQAQTPCTVVGPRQLSTYPLSPEQVVFVNCIKTGKIEGGGLENLQRYVAAGGYLTTTDWALTSVVQKAFPGYIEHNGVQTGNDVVPVRMCGQNTQFLSGLHGRNLKPQWWLESSSYPIRIVGSGVDVLIASDEMARKYRDGPVVVTFDFEQGRVIHMVSHYYLQQTNQSRQGMSAKQFAEDILGLSTKGLEDALEGVSAGEAEAAFASSRFVHNIITGKRGK